MGAEEQKEGEEVERGYWYERRDSAVEPLTALRHLQDSHRELRRRMSERMGMNTTDLAALRHVIAHEVREDPLTPLRLARSLGISGASTSKLLDRLTTSGHLERVPHPTDRRSSILLATDHGHELMRERLSVMHRRMLEVAEDIPAGSRRDVADFLLGMSRVLDAETSSLNALTDDDQAGTHSR